MEPSREAQDLAVAECLRLLRSVPVGRMVFTEGALPAVHPVDYVMSGADVVLRTGRGPKLDSALRGDVVAFEADDIDPTSRTGWSVLVVGHASVLAGGATDLPLPPPVGLDGAPFAIRIAGERITGRRVGARVES
jgi:nitroimidazol reductase NimA-like FMN-containing flavoprotein (pyridoxamine 5'-phosphate oxidase superfamily)